MPSEPTSTPLEATPSVAEAPMPMVGVEIEEGFTDLVPTNAEVEVQLEENNDEQAVATQGPEPESENEPAPAPRVTFLSYMISPIVTLVVGKDDKEVTLSAHKALLVQSPYFVDEFSKFAEGEACKVVLPDEDVDTISSFLEYLYTGEYFPRKLSGQRTLEHDPSLPAVDDSGEQLLCHARVYTLAGKFGIESLRTLASSKIHCINSTVQGEIIYARYVYAHTAVDDTTIRAPIANFWATRSHMLRSEAEDEFRSLCLEYPQFGYDVLTRVLDEKLKRESKEKLQPHASTSTTGRKRSRHNA